LLVRWFSRLHFRYIYSFRLATVPSNQTVPACSHRCSLELLYTVGGNQAKLDARTKSDFCQEGGVEAGCTELQAARLLVLPQRPPTVSTSTGFPVPNLVHQVLRKQFIANRFKITVSRNRTKEAQVGCKAGTIGRLRVGTKQDLHEKFPSAEATSVILTSRSNRRSARLGYKEGSRSKQLGRGTYVTCAM
jgi:hypothetical protein